MSVFRRNPIYYTMCCSVSSCSEPAVNNCVDCGAYYCKDHDQFIHSINLNQLHNRIHNDTLMTPFKCRCNNIHCSPQSGFFSNVIGQNGMIINNIFIDYCSCYTLNEALRLISLFPLTPQRPQTVIATPIIKQYFKHFSEGQETLQGYTNAILDKFKYSSMYMNFYQNL